MTLRACLCEINFNLRAVKSTIHEGNSNMIIAESHKGPSHDNLFHVNKFLSSRGHAFLDGF